MRTIGLIAYLNQLMIRQFCSDIFVCVFFFFCRMETALKNQEMELIRNKERLQFFKVLHKPKNVFISFKRCMPLNGKVWL